MNTILKIMTPIVFVAFLAMGGVNATEAKEQADGELWPDPTTMPPDDQLEFLPILPTGEEITGPEGIFNIDLHQTLEKDGKQYKAVQFFDERLTKVTATAPVGKYLLGGPVGAVYPPDTVDPVALLTALRLVSVEIDGTVIPIDQLQYLHRRDMLYGGQTMPGANYYVFPRFNTTGTHTYRLTFRQETPFFYVEPFEAEGMIDPAPEFEGRRVLVAEQVGDPVDGNMVFEYILTVVESPTAVESSTWGRIKSTFR